VVVRSSDHISDLRSFRGRWGTGSGWCDGSVAERRWHRQSHGRLAGGAGGGGLLDEGKTERLGRGGAPTRQAGVSRGGGRKMMQRGITPSIYSATGHRLGWPLRNGTHGLSPFFLNELYLEFNPFEARSNPNRSFPFNDT
jgi:hypothetical protein